MGQHGAVTQEPAADDPEDLARLTSYASDLADAVDRTLGGWVQRVVEERWRAWRGGPPPTELVDAARRAGATAVEVIGPDVRALLGQDVDRQRSNPLALLRRAVDHATAVLRRAGVPEAARDEEARRLFPDDPYDITPAAFTDIDPTLHEPGLLWGAAKAHVILRRRRRGS